MYICKYSVAMLFTITMPYTIQFLFDAIFIFMFDTSYAIFNTSDFLYVTNYMFYVQYYLDPFTMLSLVSSVV